MNALIHTKTDFSPKHLDRTLHFKVMLPEDIRREIYNKTKELCSELGDSIIINIEASVEATVYVPEKKVIDKNEQYNGIG